MTPDTTVGSPRFTSIQELSSLEKDKYRQEIDQAQMQPLHSFSFEDCLQKVPAAVSSNASLNSGIGATGRLILIIVKEKNKTYIQSLRLRRICPWAASDYLAVYCTKHIWNHYDTARLTPLERVGRIDKAQTYSILLLCMAGKLSKVLTFNV